MADLGPQGRRCWIWQDNKWQAGRAWSIENDSSINARCRDYGDWSVPYPGSMPLETHGNWPLGEYSWTRPVDQYRRQL